MAQAEPQPSEAQNTSAVHGRIVVALFTAGLAFALTNDSIAAVPEADTLSPGYSPMRVACDGVVPIYCNLIWSFR